MILVGRGLAGLAQGGQPSFHRLLSGGSVNWNPGDTATYSTAAVMSQVTTTATLMPWWSFRTNRNYGYFTADSWETATHPVTQINTSGANYFPQGTTVQTVIDQTIYGRYLVYFSQNPNPNSGNGVTKHSQKVVI